MSPLQKAIIQLHNKSQSITIIERDIEEVIDTIKVEDAVKIIEEMELEIIKQYEQESRIYY